MNTAQTILVSGATGNVGSRVVEQLLAHGATVRALVRDPRAAAGRLGNVELVHGNFDDRASLQRALIGVDRLFLTAADGPDKVAHEQAMIDAAADAGTDLVVKLSALHADSSSNLPAFAWHGEVEEYLRRSGVPAVVLQPSFFMSNLLMIAGGVAVTDTLYAPTGGAPVSMIDIGDVAAVASRVLLDDRYIGQTLQLTGQVPVTFHQVAEALGQATGRAITYTDLSDEAARPRFEGAGLPAWLQRHLAGVFALIRAGAFSTATDVVAQVTGRPATDISDFARNHADMFSPAAIAAEPEGTRR